MISEGATLRMATNAVPFRNDWEIGHQILTVLTISERAAFLVVIGSR